MHVTCRQTQHVSHELQVGLLFWCDDAVFQSHFPKREQVAAVQCHRVFAREAHHFGCGDELVLFVPADLPVEKCPVEQREVAVGFRVHLAARSA